MFTKCLYVLIILWTQQAKKWQQDIVTLHSTTSKKEIMNLLEGGGLQNTSSLYVTRVELLENSNETP